MLIEMQRLSVAQILAVYNFHASPKIVRFESHAVGARRLRALLVKIEVTLEDAFYATFPAQRPAEEAPDVDRTPADVGFGDKLEEDERQAAAETPIAAKPRGTVRTVKTPIKSAKAPVQTPDAALPGPPDFSANTHKPYRAKLAKLIELAGAGDLAGLEAIEIKPTSSSPKALIRYRDKAVAAIRARQAA